MDKQILYDNIDKIHTTAMGMDRIKKNLSLYEADVIVIKPVSCFLNFGWSEKSNLIVIMKRAHRDTCKHRYFLYRFHYDSSPVS